MLGGHSWGSWLAIDYALTLSGKSADADPPGDTVADMPLRILETVERLRAALSPETVSMMQKH